MSRLVVALAMAILRLQPAGAATLDRIREAGAIKLGYRTDARPYSFRNENGQPAGYVVELCREVANAVAKTLGGIRTDFVLVPAHERFQAVHERRIDILCDPSSITLERRVLVDFSLPTFLDGASVLARSSRPVQRFEDLTGRRVGVLGNTTSEHTLRRPVRPRHQGRRSSRSADHNAGIDLLTSDRIDAYFADRAIIASCSYEGRLPGFQLSRSISPTRPMRWPCPATTAPSACWSTARWPGSTAAAGSRRIMAKTLRRASRRTTCCAR